MHRELNVAERVLFHHIASNITKNADEYFEAGKWLNRYYDDDKLCSERRKMELLHEIHRLENGEVDFGGEDELFLQELKNELEEKEPPRLWMRLAYALEDLWFSYRMGGVIAEEDAGRASAERQKFPLAVQTDIFAHFSIHDSAG